MSAWEERNPETIVKTNFRDRRTGLVDLQASVYEIETAGVENAQRVALRAQVEHSFSATDSPREALAVDVSTSRRGRLVATRGETLFEYTNARHRELHFRDDGQVKGFIADLIRSGPTTFAISIEDQVAYAAERVDGGDVEWGSAFQSKGAGTKWSKKIRKKMEELRAARTAKPS